MMVSKRDLLFQGAIFRFHVKLQGCISYISRVFSKHPCSKIPKNSPPPKKNSENINWEKTPNTCITTLPRAGLMEPLDLWDRARKVASTVSPLPHSEGFPTSNLPVPSPFGSKRSMIGYVQGSKHINYHGLWTQFIKQSIIPQCHPLLSNQKHPLLFISYSVLSSS